MLQRDQPIRVWGWGDVGEHVTVTLTGAHNEKAGTASAIADSLGHWRLALPPHAAGGGPYTLTVQGSNTLTVNDLLLGDVWVASGQSNMEMPLAGFPNSAEMKNGPEEIRNANHPEIRLLHEPKRPSMYPLDDQPATWELCTPETATSFSAVAYFFAREIQQDQKVPIGVIEADWGGTLAEAWTSLDTLGSDPALMPVFAQRAAEMDQQVDLEALQAKEKKDDAEAKATGRTPTPHGWHPPVEPWAAASLFNGMIAPLRPLTIRGVIWYQGESNSGLGRAPLYHRVFSSMIGDWRRQSAEGDFPFLYVQISSFRSSPLEDWGTLRDAQRRTLSVANTAMAVTLDVGDPGNVHPSDKQTVGHRLALAAKAQVYGEPVHWSGPLFREATQEPHGLRVWFDGADGKLAAHGGALHGFELAGTDHKFVSAIATIAADGRSILVESDSLAEPRYVRYAWENAPDANLTDSAGLPASTFSSEPVPAPPAR